MRQIDIAVIGGGCAGMSAALRAHKSGSNAVIFERSKHLGGVLRQCIHNGFGLHRYYSDMTGTEYAKRLTDETAQAGIEALTECIVLDISKDLVITASSVKTGLAQYQAKAVVLAMGCRERPRGALMIPGSRPAGIFTAGTAQRYMNLEGYGVGSEIIILGSGDIGLIMARQFILDGAKVKAVFEIMPYSAGLTRNIVQCLDDFGIPLRLNTTVTRIEGKERISGVYFAQVDSRRVPIPETERFVSCDTLILSVGLIPENELTRRLGAAVSPGTGGAIVDDGLQTEIDGVFSCGNVLHVHDLVDFVSFEAEAAGENAALYAQTRPTRADFVCAVEGSGIRSLVPQRITLRGGKEITLRFRPDNRYENCRIEAYCGGEIIASKRKSVVTPGEMCEITIARSDINADVEVAIIK